MVTKKKYVEVCGTKSSPLRIVGACGFGPSAKLFGKKSRWHCQIIELYWKKGIKTTCWVWIMAWHLNNCVTLTKKKS